MHVYIQRGKKGPPVSFIGMGASSFFRVIEKMKMKIMKCTLRYGIRNTELSTMRLDVSNTQTPCVAMLVTGGG